MANTSSTVPALTYNPFFSQYADCVWKVHVDFGDGTSEDYVFDAAVGLTGEHVFPTPGVTYTVQVQLREGVHSKTEEPCPDYGLNPMVRYRTAAEEADDPPETPTEPPFVPTGPGGTPPRRPSRPTAGSPTSGSRGPGSARYWKRCRGGVYAHLVRCGKARGIASAAAAKLTRPGTARRGASPAASPAARCSRSPASAASSACSRRARGTAPRRSA